MYPSPFRASKTSGEKSIYVAFWSFSRIKFNNGNDKTDKDCLRRWFGYVNQLRWNEMIIKPTSNKVIYIQISKAVLTENTNYLISISDRTIHLYHNPHYKMFYKVPFESSRNLVTNIASFINWIGTAEHWSV